MLMRFVRRLRSSLRGQRGTVMVLVAAALFPIFGMMTFAIDVSHWFDYSRNLQNRADAAALAGGTQYGTICFQSSFGDQWTGLQSAVGKWAQLYSGPGLGEPADENTNPNPAANVPYSDLDVATATGTPPSPVYKNQPNLQLGSLNDYYVLLNANNYADKGGKNFAMGDFCNSDPAKDMTDKDPGDPGAMVDVKVTQRQLPNFIPLFNVHPNIEAHARVEIQQIQSEVTSPIAVNDASFIPCVTANFLDADGSVIAHEALHRSSNDPSDPDYNLWSTSTGTTVNVPSGNTDPVTVQLFLNNCSTTSPTGIHYDYFDNNGNEKQLGLVYIHNWGSPASPPATPEIVSGGVTLTGSADTPCDPYFQTSSGACSVDVRANIGFATPPAGVSYDFRAVDGTDPTTNFKALDNGGGGTVYTTASSFSFGSDSGPHPIHIFYAQLGGKIGNQTCNTSGDPWVPSNKNCRVDLGVQQRAFSGINGTNLCSDPAFDTGPMQWISVGDVAGGSGANAFAGGSNPTLYVTTSIVGLSNSGPTDPPICLRVAEKTSHATGFIDCGQGNGTPNDQNALQNGCPNPVQINTRVAADGALTCTPSISPADCVQNNPGESSPVLKGLDNLIGNPAPGNCETNYWPYNPNTRLSSEDVTHVSLDDKRALVMIITAPTDMAVAHGTSDIPVRDFAVFYVTGWSTGNGGVQGCTGPTDPNNPALSGANDPPPPGAGSGEIWGHWTSLAVPSGLGTSNGKQCKFTEFGNCIAVLTR
jgi:Putative Flp pilus-assembly TadE/G-like